jgi:flagella basal body P-ring formation protein FlgA
MLMPFAVSADDTWRSILEEKIAKECSMENVMLIIPTQSSVNNNAEYVSHSYDQDPSKVEIVVKYPTGQTESIHAKFVEAIATPVLLEHMKKGDSLDMQNVKFIKFPKQRDSAVMIKDLHNLDGLVARKNINPNKPLLSHDFAKPVAIIKGKTVKMLYIKDSLSIETNGTALESGSVDDYIKVRNNDGNKVINAKVINEGAVLVN